MLRSSATQALRTAARSSRCSAGPLVAVALRWKSTTVLPVLDVAAWREGGHDVRSRFAADLRAACEHTGFFYLRNHGCEDILAKGTKELRDFFAQPEAVKQKVHHGLSTVHPPTCRGWQTKEWLDPLRAGKGDTKQTIQMGYDVPQPQPPKSAPFLGPNMFPDEELPLMRLRLNKVFSSLHGVSLELLQAFAVSIGLQDEQFFSRVCGHNSMTMARGLYYPKATEEPDEVGCSAHTDYGVLTLLHQTGPGLQVLRADAACWLDVPPIEGHLICNIADLIERWTNGKYVSSVHRVMVPPGAPERYSYGFFLEADFDTVVAPVPECCRDQPAKYEAVVAGEHKLSKTRIQYGEDVEDAADLFSRTLISARAASPEQAARI